MGSVCVCACTHVQWPPFSLGPESLLPAELGEAEKYNFSPGSTVLGSVMKEQGESRCWAIAAAVTKVDVYSYQFCHLRKLEGNNGV